MKKHKRPTLADVAREAGVSETTVSVVLNKRVGQSARVSEDTQEKIWAAVRALGYVANPVARTLASGQNRIVAVFTFESLFPIEYRSFYYPFLIGIEQEAERQGYNLLLVTGSNDSSGKRRIYDNGANRLQLADGAVLLGFENKLEVLQLLDENYPFVFIGKRESPQDNISYVGADYVEATIHLMQTLFEYGHRQTVYFRSVRQREPSKDRETGYRTAYQRFGIPLYHANIWQDETPCLTPEVLQQFLQAGCTAFVAEDDEIGLHLMAVAEHLGKKPPHDYSLVVLGNPLNPSLPVPDWTCFNIPRQEMGREAMKMLIQMLNISPSEREFPYRKMLECTFVPGSTVARPR